MQSPSSNTGDAKSQACGNCARAKAKCISQFDDISSQQCARCFRLKKECVVQPRAKRKKRASNIARTTELESKIESLVSLLSAAQIPKFGQTEDHEMPSSPKINFPRDPSFSKFSNGFAREGRPSQLNSVGASFPNSTRATTPPSAFSLNYTPTETGSTQSSTVLQSKSPNELLEIFRVQFTVQFSYAIISPDVTAVELHGKQPWLYRMIMMAASSHERHKQIETGTLIISDLSTAMLTRGEKTLDMLQALLVYASWSHFFANVLPQVHSTGIVQLVLALIYDLGLSKASRFDGETGGLLVEAKIRFGERNNLQGTEQSLDECRALLYAFYLSSTISTCIRKADGLQFSPYLDYSCKMLLESAECDADRVLVACARFQSIADSVHRALPNRYFSSDGHNAPIWMHTDHLKSELQCIFKGLSSDLQNHVITRLSYYSVEIFLLDAAILETRNEQAFNSRRIDLRWNCLMAGKSLLDAFLTMPISAYYAVPITILSQLTFCLMNLFRLAFVEDLGWDLVHVRDTVNLASYFDNFASKLKEVGAAIDSTQNPPAKESFQTVCSRAIIWVKGWYDAKVASGANVGQPFGQQPKNMMESSSDMLTYNTFDCMDEIYWQELMADFSYTPMQQSGSNDVV